MIKLFLAGDVMLGRGIEQILRQPRNPELYEHHIKSAQGYVLPAERANGPMARPRFVGSELHP
jgi:poly-gamma-glutamate synthesis protein (capsule biosynthesis protein)